MSDDQDTYWTDPDRSDVVGRVLVHAASPVHSRPRTRRSAFGAMPTFVVTRPADGRSVETYCCGCLVCET